MKPIELCFYANKESVKTVSNYMNDDTWWEIVIEIRILDNLANQFNPYYTFMYLEIYLAEFPKIYIHKDISRISISIYSWTPIEIQI